MFLYGDLDHHAQELLEEVLAQLPKPTDDVLIDMGGVTFMDVAGLRLVSRLCKAAHTKGLSVRFIGWREQPRRLLELAEAVLGPTVKHRAGRRAA
ncbi:STAS domain-containing protein [Streptomyces sp. NPDC054842]